MAQRVEEEVFERAGHVDIVCGTRRIHHLPELVDELRERRARFSSDLHLLATEEDVEVAVERAGETYTGGAHGYLAVMRGCDLNCTFCVVPRVRGRVQSRPIDDLVREAEWMVDQGARVITLLGQTVNSYGEDFAPPATGTYRGRQGRPSLADLLERMQAIDGLARIRLVTLHPSYVTRALAEAMRDNDKVDRFLPLPAQSGSDRILKAMKRGYTTDLYRRRVEILRGVVPDIELGSDWIVGFPTETDADFAQSEAFLEEMGFAQNYVFKYDPRPDTAAWEKLADDVPRDVKKARNQRLLRKSEEVARRRLERYVGETLEVVVDAVSERHPGRVHGRTRHNLPVSLPGDAALVDTTVSVRIEQASPYGLAGVVTG
jgi:tRNA-2-methylthio-N6-dimethylallyladenosine synthase